MYHLSFGVWCKVLLGKHVVNARFCWGLENAFCKGIRNEELDLVGAFSLCAPLSHLQISRKESTSALGVHALRILAGGHGVLDDRREAIITIANLDVPSAVKNVNRRLGCNRWRTGTERKCDFFVAVHQRRPLVRGGLAGDRPDHGSRERERRHRSARELSFSLECFRGHRDLFFRSSVYTPVHM